jgi:hypothetical protein
VACNALTFGERPDDGRGGIRTGVALADSFDASSSLSAVADGEEAASGTFPL